VLYTCIFEARRKVIANYRENLGIQTVNLNSFFFYWGRKLQEASSILLHMAFIGEFVAMVIGKNVYLDLHIIISTT
jgi:polyferredoxin